jgi:hypothetical protein
MAYAEARLVGVQMPVHQQDQLETHLADLFDYALGQAVRSDVRITLWEPITVYGGELTDIERDALIHSLMEAISTMAGPLDATAEPRVEFAIIPETAREDLEKQIADHSFQIEERRRAIERYRESSPQTVALLMNEIERLQDYIHELEITLDEMGDDDDDIGLEESDYE